MTTKTTSSGSKKSGMGGVSNMSGGYTTIAVYGGKMSGTAYAGSQLLLFRCVYSHSQSIIFCSYLSIMQTLNRTYPNHSLHPTPIHHHLPSLSPSPVFAGSNYRLGSCSTELVVSELAQGLLPIGGLAYHLANCCDEGE